MRKGVTDECICYERNPDGTYNVRFDMDSKTRYFTTLNTWKEVQQVQFGDFFEWDYEDDEEVDIKNIKV